MLRGSSTELDEPAQAGPSGCQASQRKLARPSQGVEYVFEGLMALLLVAALRLLVARQLELGRKGSSSSACTGLEEHGHVCEFRRVLLGLEKILQQTAHSVQFFSRCTGHAPNPE